MPTLKQLTCQLEHADTQIPLREHATTYSDGFVGTNIAIPSTPIPFAISLSSRGYIAPGLAMFVFIDGVYQCNRNQQDLKIPSDSKREGDMEIRFRVRQKEQRVGDDTWLGQQWKFEQLRMISSGEQVATDAVRLDSVGTIEVVVLRCQAGPKAADFSAATTIRERPSRPQESTTGAAKTDKTDVVDSSEIGAFGGLFDGASDQVRPVNGQLPFGLDGNWDEPVRPPDPDVKQQWSGSSRTGNGSHRDRHSQWQQLVPPSAHQSWDAGRASPGPSPSVMIGSNESAAAQTASPAVLIQVGTGNYCPPGKTTAQASANRAGPATQPSTDPWKVSSQWQTERGHGTWDHPSQIGNGGNENDNVGGNLGMNWAGHHAGGADKTGSAQQWDSGSRSGHHGDNFGPPQWGNHQQWNRNGAQNTFGDNNTTASGGGQQCSNYRTSTNGVLQDNWNPPMETTANNPDSNPNKQSHEGSPHHQRWQSDGPVTDNWVGNNQSTTNDQSGRWQAVAPPHQQWPSDQWMANGTNNGNWITAEKPTDDMQVGESASVRPDNVSMSRGNHGNPPWGKAESTFSYGKRSHKAPSERWGASPPSVSQHPASPPQTGYPPVPNDTWVATAPFETVSAPPPRTTNEEDFRPKAYWTNWVRPSATETNVSRSEGAFINSDDDLLSGIPEDVARQKGVSHQVRPGKAAVYAHRVLRPSYLDSMESPYAVFVFKYRSREILSAMLNTTIEDDSAEEEKQRLASLSKEEIIAELLQIKASSKPLSHPNASPHRSYVPTHTTISSPPPQQPQNYRAPSVAAAPALESTPEPDHISVVGGLMGGIGDMDAGGGVAGW